MGRIGNPSYEWTACLWRLPVWRERSPDWGRGATGGRVEIRGVGIRIGNWGSLRVVSHCAPDRRRSGPSRLALPRALRLADPKSAIPSKIGTPCSSLSGSSVAHPPQVIQRRLRTISRSSYLPCESQVKSTEADMRLAATQRGAAATGDGSLPLVARFLPEITHFHREWWRRAATLRTRQEEQRGAR